MCSCPSKLEGRVSHAFVPPAGKQHAEPRVLLIPGKETKHHGARQFKGAAGPLHHRTRAFWPFGQMGENSVSALGGRYCGRWVLQKFLHLFAWQRTTGSYPETGLGKLLRWFPLMPDTFPGCLRAPRTNYWQLAWGGPALRGYPGEQSRNRLGHASHRLPVSRYSHVPVS